jgi:hypothetical protein
MAVRREARRIAPGLQVFYVVFAAASRREPTGLLSTTTLT